jgi:hypothetical protein
MIPNETPGLPLPAPIADQEWNMAVTVMKDGGGFATLRQLISFEAATVPLSDLTVEQWTAVISERIKGLPSFEIYMFGAGVINRERALSEVEHHSNVGQALIEIEQNLIRNLYSRALHEA